MLADSIWDMLPDTIEKPDLEADSFWEKYVRTHTQTTVHVAILAKPYLDLVLNSIKTVESRFSVDKRAPYHRVNADDIVLLKQVGGPISGIARVSKVWFYEINPKTFWSIRCNFGERLQIEDQEMWERYRKASYATLIELDNVRRLEPISYTKRDQRAWVIFRSELSQLPLPLG